MTKYINVARQRELDHIWHLNMLQVFIHQVVSMAPIASLVAMFSLYVGVRGEPLTAAVAFTTLSLVDMMRSNMGRFG